MVQGASLRDTARSLWHAQRIKRLVRDRLGVAGMQSLVSVRETICDDPGCEGPATEVRIVLLGVREIRAAIHKPASEVSGADVAEFFGEFDWA